MDAKEKAEKKDNVIGFIYGMAILIMICIMLLGPILWALGYGGNNE